MQSLMMCTFFNHWDTRKCVLKPENKSKAYNNLGKYGKIKRKRSEEIELK